MPEMCSECKGTGKIGYRVEPSRDDVRIGNTVVVDGGGYSARPCKCVSSLPIIHGEATWWGSEIVWATAVPLLAGVVEIQVKAEIPYAENGRRVFRTAENSYSPATIDFGESLLMVEDARALGKALLHAADVAEAADTFVSEGAAAVGEEETE